MPNRIIKESICASENVDQLTPFQETFFVRLIVNCDDYGRMDARVKILSSRLYPLKDVTPRQVEDALKALASADLITLYEVDGKPYLQMKTWEKHQQVRAKKSKYPAQDSACEQMISNDIKCPRNPIQSNPNPNPIRIVEPQKRFTPPSIEEVAAYCQERNNGIDAEYFVDYQTARDWVLSNGKKMRDWKATVRTWEKNGFNRNGGKSGKTVLAQQYGQRDYSDENNDDVYRKLGL